MKSTSLMAYRKIESSGLLSRRRLEAWKLLMEVGPSTGNELDVRAPGIVGLWKRLSELRGVGLARERGKRPCKVTGFLATEWEAVVPDWAISAKDVE